MLSRLSKKIGFTETELKVVLFFTFTLVAGFTIKNFLREKPEINNPEQFDYSLQDSLFYNLPGDLDSNSQKMNLNKEVDYKQEVLDFNNRSFKKSTKKTLPAENSININTAPLEDFMKLPGIGPKTAQSIVDLRTKLGNFKKVDDLLKVKGIGNTKLNNIKKYIFIE
ncbi:MAG TPA: ComEA family DNA-binding protein [Ignavibacteriaceae bacterium]|nr:ComEA family DNA-binding protein [Ignavibacteriaceae bacterium]